MKLLLEQWCRQLLKLQITQIDDPALRGGILCPACGRIHGRCFDAIYPFMYLADTLSEERYVNAAKALFDWAENTVSLPDGSYRNDANSQWQGTTVFSVIQLAKALEFHGHLLDDDTKTTWLARIERAADFLRDYKEFEVCNINYRITNALAMELCARLLKRPDYEARGRELMASALSQISDSGILFGEGRPVDGKSPRGCRSVDIGYNVEESLPALMEYGVETGDETIRQLAVKALQRHLLFFLEDGGIDNSFGTRNYKWTYWGSRTSDGCGLGYLLAAKESCDPAPFAAAARRNLQLLNTCTHDGFLYGGPHMQQKGEYPCIHHQFSHAKVLAEILDRNLDLLLAHTETEDRQPLLPRTALEHPLHVSETDTWLIPGQEYTATVTAYDWIYGDVTGGHASGGALSLLHHHILGPILCASMSRYQMKEAGNMQLPRFSRHECLTPRLEYGGSSNLYDQTCTMVCQHQERCTTLSVSGCFPDIADGYYTVTYRFFPDSMQVNICCPQNTRMVLPLISEASENATPESAGLVIDKQGHPVHLAVSCGKFTLPYGTERIYNLVPGLEAIRADIISDKDGIAFCISF